MQMMLARFGAPVVCAGERESESEAAEALARGRGSRDRNSLGGCADSSSRCLGRRLANSAQAQRVAPAATNGSSAAPHR